VPTDQMHLLGGDRFDLTGGVNVSIAETDKLALEKRHARSPNDVVRMRIRLKAQIDVAAFGASLWQSRNISRCSES
jgi:hypothetical protein